MSSVRKMVVDGSFYPASSVQLKDFIDEKLSHVADEKRTSNVRALVVPHAGYQFSGAIAARAYASVLKQRSHFKRVVVIAPTHRVYFRGISIGNYDAYETPFGDLPVDKEGCRLLLDSGGGLITFRHDAHSAEHAVEVQLPFIYQIFGEIPIIPLVCGELTEGEFKSLAGELKGLWTPETLWVISSDFTHYGSSFGYVPFSDNIQENLMELDSGAIAEIMANDAAGFSSYISTTGATVCGHNPIQLLLNVTADEELDVCLREYTTSAALTGDEEHSVSYAAIVLADKTDVTEDEATFVLDDEERKLLHQLVRESISSRFSGEELHVDEQLISETLRNRASCFVTLHLAGQLRGCIGHLEAMEPLYFNVIHNARAAAFGDPRFMPLSEEEFDSIDIEISVLTPSRYVDGYEDIVLGKHGIILEKGRARAVFLPQVATEQGWDLPTTLAYLSQKAGLESSAWQSGAKFKVFEALVF